ncbi:MAG TPA: ABC transporter substrate-binding protein [Thermomicrobiales bacterium]|nr:ABC transporter substrate-binding protein [Thermomicrobiales bacterium]
MGASQDRRLTRRALLGGLAASGAAALLAACGGTAPTNTPAVAPATAPATKPAGGAVPTGATGAATAPPTPAAASPAAAQPTAAGTPKQGGSIILGTLGEASTINPFVANDTEGDFRVKLLFGQLVRLDPQSFAPKPMLAKSWQAQGNTFTFTLQDNTKFSDGSDLTADDVAFTMKGILAKATASPRQSFLLSIQGAQEYANGTAQDVAGIKVTDPKTLVVTLAQPDASFLANMRYVSPVPKKMLDGKDLSKTSKEPFFQKPIGAGPFVFSSWQVGGDFVAERNPYYFEAGKPYLDKMTHRTIPDAQSLVNALLSGDIDGSNYPSPAGADKLRASKDLNVLVPPFTAPDGWEFNVAHPYLSKKEVRQAVAYALDIAQFAKDSLYGLGKPGVGPIAPGNYAFDKSLKPIPYDLDKAKSLLQQAGAPPDNVSFIVNKGNVLREDFLTYTQAQLAKIGWKINAQTIEYATLIDRLTKKDFDVQGVTPGTGATLDPGELYNSYLSTSPANYSGYSNPKLDDLLKQAKEQLDPQQQIPIYAQIQQILMDDLPVYYAWYRPFLHVAKKKFTGYVDSVDIADMHGLSNTLQDWYVVG